MLNDTHEYGDRYGVGGIYSSSTGSAGVFTSHPTLAETYHVGCSLHLIIMILQVVLLK